MFFFILTLSAGLLGLITILWTSGLAQKIPLISNIQFLNSVLWSPTGSPLATLSLFLAFLPLLALQLLREKVLHFKSLLLAISFVLVLVASGLISYRLFLSPDLSSYPVFLPHRFSWAIALETLKISPFLGTGPGSYSADFTQLRPVTYNLTHSGPSALHPEVIISSISLQPSAYLAPWPIFGWSIASVWLSKNLPIFIFSLS